jgi:predicted ATPase
MVKPIKSAEIKVNDLTLIFGDNNTGKTYLAYALYGLLSKWGNIALGIEFLSFNFFAFNEVNI